MQISRAGRYNKGSGFTLLEIVLVLFIFSLMLGLVTPKVVTGLYFNSKASFLRRFSGAQEYARTQAMIDGQKWVMQLDLDGSRLRLLPFKDLKKAGGLKAKPKWKDLGGVKIRDVESEKGKLTENGNFEIIFTPRGLAAPVLLHLADQEGRPVKTVQLKPFNRSLGIFEGYVSYSDIKTSQE